MNKNRTKSNIKCIPLVTKLENKGGNQQPAKGKLGRGNPNRSCKPETCPVNKNTN